MCVCVFVFRVGYVAAHAIRTYSRLRYGPVLCVCADKLRSAAPHTFYYYFFFSGLIIVIYSRLSHSRCRSSNIYEQQLGNASHFVVFRGAMLK